MSHVEVKVNVPSGTVVLNRPQAGNALSREMIDELSEALFDLHQEKRVRGVILTASGPNFCSGLDLKQMHQTALGDPNAALASWHEDWTRLCDLLEKMLRFPKPIVAAVDGAVLGGGLGLALAADMVIASPDASVGIPAVRRGLVSGVVVPLIQFRAGGKVAARMMLTGEALTADEALRSNLIDQIVDADKIWVAAHQAIQNCALGAPEAILLSKRLLNETVGEQLMTQLTVGAAIGASACTTESANEGLAAFVEHRNPQWP